jgi:hypothetical protein
MDKQKVEGCEEIVVGRVERLVRKIVGAVVGIDGMGIAIRLEDKAGKVEVRAGLDWG